MDKSKKLHFVPVSLLNKIIHKPEVALYLIVELYKKLYPKATDEKIYDAIEDFLEIMHFTAEGALPAKPKKEELN